MEESLELVIRFAGLIVAILVARWVYHDATRLKQNGADITPGLWTTVVFLLCFLGLPIYGVLRWTLWRRYQTPLPDVAKEFE